MQPQSRPTPTQDSILRDGEHSVFWVLGGNRSGKSQTGGRIVSWWFRNEHPYLQRRPEWGNGPLQILVVGKLGEQLESELWEKKIRPFLDDGSYKVVRIGNVIKRVVHRRNRNSIIFMSHFDAVNAWAKVQSFTAQVVWLDEMPDHARIVSELVIRTRSSRGFLYATFTPLVRNEDIRKQVDTAAPGVRRVQLSMLDNPVYRGRETDEEAVMRATCTSESEYRARMFGDWYYGDTRVCPYDAQLHMRRLPEHYHPRGWRHLAVLDPAASGYAGLTVWAEDPADGRWWCVKAEYLKGAAAFDLLNMVEAELQPYTVQFRWCDCNPAGFYKEAIRQHIPWMAYTDKNDRKLVTINQFNTQLLQGRAVLAPAAYRLAEELVKCTWSDRDPNKIQTASKYHLFDSARYALDSMPAWRPTHNLPKTADQEIRYQWHKRQEHTAKAAKAHIVQRRSKWNRTNRSWSRSVSLGR